MSEKDAFLKKINSDLETVQIRFSEFKAQAKRLQIDDQIKQHAKHVADLERKVNATKAKLKELGEADDDTWDLLADGVVNTWTDLQFTLEDTVTAFKEA
jgi:predicted  nucleic acid-binding Zn-ribbon protein